MLLAICSWSHGACSHSKAKPFPSIIPELYTENHHAGDPYNGRFPLTLALADLPKSGQLYATIETDLGPIECKLMVEQTPLAVANFVGLARGLRPFLDKKSGHWIRDKYYDGLTWHRAQPGEFIQAGKRNRQLHPGFRIQDERPIGDRFDHPGVLALANIGQDHTSGAEFFITTARLPALNQLYTIIGRCSDLSLLRQIESAILKQRKPPPQILHITIERRQDNH